MGKKICDCEQSAPKPKVIPMDPSRRKSITCEEGRHFLTDRIRLEVDWHATPQSRGIAPPPSQKPPGEGKRIITLPPREAWRIPPSDLVSAMARRESRRRYLPDPLSLEELAFLLWSAQGVRTRLHEAAVLRIVPSAGCRHPFETYLAVFNVQGIPPALYRYLPLDHALVLEREIPAMASKLAAAAHGQRFAGDAAVTFIWTAIPARTEWRYAEASYKVIALDAGHLCQNLYLACEAIGAGTCAIAAYNQHLTDNLLEVDGRDEFAVYLAPVGKV